MNIPGTGTGSCTISGSSKRASEMLTANKSTASYMNAIGRTKKTPAVHHFRYHSEVAAPTVYPRNNSGVTELQQRKEYNSQQQQQQQVFSNENQFPSSSVSAADHPQISDSAVAEGPTTSRFSKVKTDGAASKENKPSSSLLQQRRPTVINSFTSNVSGVS